MRTFYPEKIAEATGGSIICGGAATFSGVSIDSRKIRPSDLFVALKGSRFDGHDFLGDALKKCSGAMVSDISKVPASCEKTVIRVENTLAALQDLARSIRRRPDLKVAGITGTNGKTSTKEMACSIFRIFSRTLCTSGNFNNQIGLPLNLLKLEDEEFCILEMGASKKGDIAELCEIALPDYGVITNIGPGHLEGFGSIEGVRDAKLDIGRYVKTLVVNGDNPVLCGGAESLAGKSGFNLVKFGIRNEGFVTAANIREDAGSSGTVFDIGIKGRKNFPVKLAIPGIFNVYNGLAAAALAAVAGLPSEVIRKGLESFTGVPMRFEIMEVRGAVIISDMYNANPASMEEAVKELVRTKRKRAIAVLGDMLELGSFSSEEHRKLGAWIGGLPIDVFIAVGPLMKIAADEIRSRRNGVYTAPDAVTAGKIFRELGSREGDTVLIKGSRGMNMEKVLEESNAV